MNTRAATRYAKAIIELASEQKLEEVVQNDMLVIAASIQGSKDLQNVLQSPIIKNSDKKAAIDTIFKAKVNDLTSKMFDLLATNKRLDLMLPIAQQYGVLYQNQKGIVKAVVTSAIALDESMTAKVLQKAREIVGNKQIIIENKIDETILGGFNLRVGDVQMDLSISNQLQRLKREFIEN